MQIYLYRINLHNLELMIYFKIILYQIMKYYHKLFNNAKAAFKILI